MLSLNSLGQLLLNTVEGVEFQHGLVVSQGVRLHLATNNGLAAKKSGCVSMRLNIPQYLENKSVIETFLFLTKYVLWLPNDRLDFIGLQEPGQIGVGHLRHWQIVSLLVLSLLAPSSIESIQLAEC